MIWAVGSVPNVTITQSGFKSNSFLVTMQFLTGTGFLETSKVLFSTKYVSTQKVEVLGCKETERHSQRQRQWSMQSMVTVEDGGSGRVDFQMSS